MRMCLPSGYLQASKYITLLLSVYSVCRAKGASSWGTQCCVQDIAVMYPPSIPILHVCIYWHPHSDIGSHKMTVTILFVMFSNSDHFCNKVIVILLQCQLFCTMHMLWKISSFLSVSECGPATNHQHFRLHLHRDDCKTFCRLAFSISGKHAIFSVLTQKWASVTWYRCYRLQVHDAIKFQNISQSVHELQITTR